MNNIFIPLNSYITIFNENDYLINKNDDGIINSYLKNIQKLKDILEVLLIYNNKI